MATIARTDQMFFGVVENETTVRNPWVSVARFLMRVMTPAWVFGYADELAEEYADTKK
jgi:hypothetical protein